MIYLDAIYVAKKNKVAREIGKTMKRHLREVSDYSGNPTLIYGTMLRFEDRGVEYALELDCHFRYDDERKLVVRGPTVSIEGENDPSHHDFYSDVPFKQYANSVVAGIKAGKAIQSYLSKVAKKIGKDKWQVQWAKIK